VSQDQLPQPTSATPLPRPAAGRPVILVIDDEAPLLDLLRTILEQEGYTVLLAPDGQNGLAQALDAQPDLVLTDVMLPHMNGRELCRQLRADPRTAHIPVIGMSVAYLPHDADAFDAILTKPFPIPAVLAVIHAQLGGAP
jgi:two-component system, OmpR family, phosphate regulon response regulator PhoB